MIRSSARLSLCLALLAASLAASAADEPASDRWYVDTRGDVPFRSRHVTRTRQADGNWHYHCVSRSRFNFLGRRQELIEDFECVVTPTWEPVSCRCASQAASGDAEVTGRVEDGALVLALKRGDLEYERRIPLAGRVVFDDCLADVLAEASGRTDTLELVVIETGSWDSAAATAKRLADENDQVRWELAGGRDGELQTKGIWCFDQNKELDHAVVGALGSKITMARATPEGAGELRELEFSDRDLLMFASQRDIPFPERQQSITVQLTWTGTPLDMLELEDARQQVVSHRQDGDRHELVLRLAQPAAVEDAPPLPVSDPELARYLAETRFIKPRDPSIAKQARQWTAGCQTTLEAVQKLSHEVAGYLQGGDLIAETLSGPEVLACRKGKCSEYTTLLASLARSVGVPTRVALGMRMVGGRWIGHMWCETWVGRWIPVDATADEVGGSPALLKITHSDTVMGTQPARFALAASLDLKVTDVVAPLASAAKWQTGVEGLTYTNADFGCRVSAPGEKWKVLDHSKPGVVTIQFKSDAKFDGGEPLVHFVAFALPGGLTPAAVVNARKAQFQSAYKGFEIVADEALMVGDDDGRRFVFRQQDPTSEERKIKTSEFVWSHEGSGYLVNVIAEESVHDAVLPQVEAILKSFALLPAAPAPAE